ncbi:VanW family protein, partial [Acinetobacter baumannii]
MGKRTKDKGFQTAGVFKNGKHDKETGGGICQVSTTLYNAVLRADLEVVTRQPHSMPVWYVPPGQDATVSYPDLDFAFRNNRSEPIAL